MLMIVPLFAVTSKAAIKEDFVPAPENSKIPIADSANIMTILDAIKVSLSMRHIFLLMLLIFCWLGFILHLHAFFLLARIRNTVRNNPELLRWDNYKAKINESQ